MPVHPDLTASRAVDACGGTYSSEEEASRYAEGHRDALDAALEAVKEPDALMEALLAACRAALSAANELDLSSAHFPRPQLEAVIATAETPKWP